MTSLPLSRLVLRLSSLEYFRPFSKEVLTRRGRADVPTMGCFCEKCLRVETLLYSVTARGRIALHASSIDAYCRNINIAI